MPTVTVSVSPEGHVTLNANGVPDHLTVLRLLTAAQQAVVEEMAKAERPGVLLATQLPRFGNARG